MAKITGVGTGWKGKVGNYVFSMLNGAQIVKTRVVPYNPQSTEQQANRGRMTDLVAFAKSIASTWIRNVWSSTVSGNQTTWGNFIRENLNAMGSGFNAELLVAAKGSVAFDPTYSGTYTDSSGLIDLEWEADPVLPNSDPQDSVAVLVVNEGTKEILAAGLPNTPRVRDDAGCQITVAPGLTATDIAVYVVFYRGTWTSGGVTAVSNSERFVLAAPTP